MSILIKDMEMPVNCFLCELSYMSGERLFCSAMKNEEVLRSKIDSNCPLIELPPHGDLISREWLVDISLHLMNIAKNDDIANGVKWLWQYVIEAPAIIEEEGEE